MDINLNRHPYLAAAMMFIADHPGSTMGAATHLGGACHMPVGTVQYRSLAIRRAIRRNLISSGRTGHHGRYRLSLTEAGQCLLAD